MESSRFAYDTGFVMLIPQFVESGAVQFYWGLNSAARRLSGGDGTFLTRPALWSYSKACLKRLGEIEGARGYGHSAEVVLPLSKPILSTVTIMSWAECMEQLHIWPLVTSSDEATADCSGADDQADNHRYRTVLLGYIIASLPLVICSVCQQIFLWQELPEGD